MPASLTQRACPVCDNAEADELLRKAELRLVRCRHCSMIYANPVEASLISGSFYDDLAPGFYLDPDKLAADYAPVRFARELTILRRFCPRGTILHVVCTTGPFLHQAQRPLSPTITKSSASMSPAAALDYAASRGVPVRKGGFLEMDFGPQKFSAVTFWATLEHLVDPAPCLIKAATVLAPGGHCFVLVPNFRSLAVRLLGPKYRYILPQHVNYFTRRLALKTRLRAKPSLSIAHLSSRPTSTPSSFCKIANPIPPSAMLIASSSSSAPPLAKQNPISKPARLVLVPPSKAFSAWPFWPTISFSFYVNP